MSLPIKYHAQLLCLVNDGQGHQWVELALALYQEKFYWNTMFQDVTNYVQICPHCQTAKDDDVDPKTKLSTIIAHKSLNLLCTKVDPSKDSRKNILLLTDTFIKFSQAFITPNQKVLIIVQILLDKWFYMYAIPHTDS